MRKESWISNLIRYEQDLKLIIQLIDFVNWIFPLRKKKRKKKKKSRIRLLLTPMFFVIEQIEKNEEKRIHCHFYVHFDCKRERIKATILFRIDHWQQTILFFSPRNKRWTNKLLKCRKKNHHQQSQLRRKWSIISKNPIPKKKILFTLIQH